MSGWALEMVALKEALDSLQLIKRKRKQPTFKSKTQLLFRTDQ